MENDKVLDKILKCLRLAESASYNPNEAANALRAAQRLAEEHGLDLAQIEAEKQNVKPEEVKYDVVKEAAHDDFRRLNQWKVDIYHVCVALFGVRFYIASNGNRKKIYLFGTAHDVALAREVYNIILRMAYKFSREVYGSKFRKDHRAFCTGFVSCLYRRSVEFKAAPKASTGTALVVINKEDQVRQVFEQETQGFKATTARRFVRNAFAFNGGYQRGHSVSLNFAGSIK